MYTGVDDAHLIACLLAHPEHYRSFYLVICNELGMIGIKEEMLKLLEEDEAFRYAVAGSSGYSRY